jgi:hypothetical protein
MMNRHHIIRHLMMRDDEMREKIEEDEDRRQ